MLYISYRKNDRCRARDGYGSIWRVIPGMRNRSRILHTTGIEEPADPSREHKGVWGDVSEAKLTFAPDTIKSPLNIADLTWRLLEPMVVAELLESELVKSVFDRNVYFNVSPSRYTQRGSVTSCFLFLVLTLTYKKIHFVNRENYIYILIFY